MRSTSQHRIALIAHAFRLALRLLRRELRAGELRVLMAALLIAIGALTAVAFFTDRVAQALHYGAAELLAADLALSSSNPIDPAWAARAENQGLATASTLSFRSMLVKGERFQLVEVKAVSKGYPLRGQLEVAEAALAPPRGTQAIPARGTVWVDGQLLEMLGLRVGERVKLGAVDFQVARVLTFEPDRGGELFQLAPRLLMSLDDVAATRLVQPGSRVTYRLLLAGDAQAITVFRSLLSAALRPSEQLQGIDDARPELRTALNRTRQFLGLAAIASVLIAVVAVALAAKRYATRHIESVGILRCLGARSELLAATYFLQVLLLGLGASLAGCALGLLAQVGLADLLSGLLFARLPPPSWQPLAVGLTTGIGTLLGFALPPLLRLKTVAPIQVLRRELTPVTWPMRGPYAAALLTLLALLSYQLGIEATLAGYVLGGVAAVLALLAGSAQILVTALSRLRGRVGVAWRFGLANLARRPQQSVLQAVALGIGLLLLLVLTFVRSDLLTSWQRQLPADTPNFFLLNVQPRETEAVQRFLAARGLRGSTFYPMVRGRLTAVNGEPVAPEQYADPRAKRLVARDFNLSWSKQVPHGNRLVAGQWWRLGTHRQPIFSVEQGLAKTLGLQLADTLTFEVAGQPIEGPVGNLRAVVWDSFEVNFFVVTPPGILEALPTTYITSFYLPAQRREVLRELVAAFPGITVVDVDALLGKVRSIIEQAARAVQYGFPFTLLAGMAVLFAAFQTTLDERRFEAAVLRALGASRAQIVLALLSEFLALGLLAGVIAALGASLLGHWLATEVFDLSFRPDPRMWAVGVCGGAVGAAAAGLLGTRTVLSTPPLASLRTT